jgi:hypothetical protein
MRSKVFTLTGAAFTGFALLLANLSTAQDNTPIDLSGVWSANSFDTLQNPGWDIVGLFSCRCALESYDLLNSLLNDRSNDHMNAYDIIEAMEEHTDEVIANRLTDQGRAAWDAFDLADDPAIQCEPFPTFRTSLHSDPIVFEKYDDHILIKGEDLTLDRTVYTDGRGHPENLELSPAGHAIGWYEDGVFVVETVGVSPSLVDDQLTLLSSDQAYSVERYWLSDDGRQLETQVTIHDPVMLRAPLTINRPRVLTPDVELDRAPCEAIAGQF